MLVLTRKVGEKIVIGGNIELTVLEIQGTRVRLGFEAPDSVRVLRSELIPQSPPPSPSTDKPVAA